MAQILLSSTCKASVGDRETERETNKGFRASGVPPEELNLKDMPEDPKTLALKITV
jgi:hypothetical protein